MNTVYFIAPFQNLMIRKNILGHHVYILNDDKVDSGRRYQPEVEQT